MRKIAPARSAESSLSSRGEPRQRESHLRLDFCNARCFLRFRICPESSAAQALHSEVTDCLSLALFDADLQALLFRPRIADSLLC